MIIGYREIGSTFGSQAGVVSAEAFFRQLSALRAFTVVPLDVYDPHNPRHAALVLCELSPTARALAVSLISAFGFSFGLCLGRSEAVALMQQSLGVPDFASACGCQPGISVDILFMCEAGYGGQSVPRELLQHSGKRQGWWMVIEGPGNDFALRRDLCNSEASGPIGREYPIRMMRESDSLFRNSVAAIITNYNYGPLLREAVESVDRQLIQPDEFIIVDDASTDESSAVLDSLAALGKTIIRHPKNLGIVENFRFCVDNTTSDYLFFLGADNRIRSDFVLECRLALDADPTVDVAYTDVILFGVLAGELARKVGAKRIGHAPASNWDVYHWLFPDPTPEALSAFKTSNFVHGSSMYRRSAYTRVGGYRKDGQPEDHNLFYRIWSTGGGLAHIAQPLLEYRQHSTAQANNLSALQIENRGLRAQLDAAEIRFSEVEERYLHRELEIARVNAAFADLNAEYSRVSQAFSEQFSDLAARNQTISSLSAEFDRLSIAFSELNAELIRVNVAYGQQLANLDRLNEVIAAQMQEIERLNMAVAERNPESTQPI